VKGSYLLGLSLPFAFYASETLADWGSRRDLGVAIWVVLAALTLGVILAFSYGIGMWNLTPPDALPGLPWNQAG
jgi:hypothetical protein